MRESLLTAKGVSELLQIDLSTVYLWVSQDYLPYICLSEGSRRRCIRFRRSELDLWLEARSHSGRVDR